MPTSVIENVVFDCPFEEIDNDIPENGFVLYHPKQERYLCGYPQNTNGVVYLATRELAQLILDEIWQARGMTILAKKLDEVREIAKATPSVDSVIFLDDSYKPVIFFIK